MIFRGIGTDIIEIGRIQKALDRHGDRFLEHLFTPKEQAYCRRFSNPVPHLAGRFAGKEAILKAIGTGLQRHIGWKEIEIINDANGKPEVYLSGSLQPRFPDASFFLSISHCKEYATATAIFIETPA
ncbi:MAG: holo-ACP synthase [Chlamydiales bacterium]